MLLEHQNAIIYGAGGPIGGAVARAFAREGATIHLAGRTLKSLDDVAERIRTAGGTAETAEVDALDEKAVDEHADAVAAAAGSIDISFNLIARGEVMGQPLVEMRLEDFERPIRTAVRTIFLTSRAAARHMIKQGSGVILAFGGYGDPLPNLGGFQVAFGAVESLRRSLACELGPHGIRVVTLQTAGVPEAIPADFPAKAREAITNDTVQRTMLNRAATLEDVGNVAAFAASDLARTITGTAINITAGAVVD
ncbi:MAG TPA: SDR family oxidoreductase [Kribbella sp.]|nr:SDR family oxidoreductase [Kribbella sp.]